MVAERQMPVPVDAPPTKPTSGVFEGLQAMRFVAALLVLITHSTFYVSNRLVPSFPTWEAGTVGVDIFFVISGFVMMITATPFQSAPRGWRYFGMRRIVRIVPMYWIATTVKIGTLLLLPGVALHSALEPQHVIFSYLFLPSVNEVGAVEPVLGVGWTLTFEMFFYAVFAVALLLRISPFLFAGSVMVSLSIWGAFLPADTSSPWTVYLDRVTLYFVVGMAIAKLVGRGRQRWLPFIGAGCLTIASCLAITGAMDWYRSSPFRFSVVTGLVVLVVWLEPWLRGRVPSFLLFLGDASYSMYLFHPLVAPVVPLMLAKLGLPLPWVSVIGSIVLAVSVTCLIYQYIEKRLVNAGRKLPYAGRIPKAVPA